MKEGPLCSARSNEALEEPAASVPRDLGEGLLRSAVAQAEKLTRFLSAQVGNAAEAQDLMQEIYLRILRLREPEAVDHERQQGRQRAVREVGGAVTGGEHCHRPLVELRPHLASVAVAT